MSCSSLRQRYEAEKKKGALTFTKVSEIYQDVEGSVAAHKAEMEDLMRTDKGSEEIRHLQGHIAEGESLLSEIQQLRLH